MTPRRIKIQIKAMGRAFYLPLLVLFLLIPLLVVYAFEINKHKAYGQEKFEFYVLMLLQTVLPFFSAYWSILLKRVCFEQPGSEVLETMVQPYSRKDDFFFLLFYSFLAGILFFGLRFILDWTFIDYLRHLCIYFFVFSFQSLLYRLSRSAMIDLLLTFLLCVVLPWESERFPLWFLYEPPKSLSIIKGYLVFFVFALVFLTLESTLPDFFKQFSIRKIN